MPSSPLSFSFFSFLLRAHLNPCPFLNNSALLPFPFLLLFNPFITYPPCGYV